MFFRVISLLAAILFTLLSPQVANAAGGPAGYYALCLEQPTFCEADVTTKRRTAPIEYTAETAMLLHSVNNKWNSEIVQRIDMCTTEPSYSPVSCDIWSGSTKVGDCEEIAIAKKMDLLRRGYSASQLLLAVVRDSNGAGHLVLVVRTTAGNMVLDNLHPAVLPWDKAGYPLYKRQSERHPYEWTAFRL